MPLLSRLRRLLAPRRSTPRPDGPARVRFDYAPRNDDQPDPGEVVWAWVPYDEGDGRGKDRPVLVVGRDGSDLVALMLTSKDHDRDTADEARFGRYWLDIGSGDWDARRRPSEVRLDRLLRLDPAAVRRTGAALPREVFLRVARAAERVPVSPSSPGSRSARRRGTR